MATDVQETVPVSASEETPAVATKKKATTSKKAEPVAIQATTPVKKKNKKKKNKPGKYSLLVMDTIRKLGERNGSSLSKIYNESKKVNWFDQQNGRMYLRYSIRALLLNESLIQMKGIGANGSFRLNKKKLDKKPAVKKGPTRAGKVPATPTKKAKKPQKPKKPASKTVRAKVIPRKKPSKSPVKKTAKPKKATKKPTPATKKLKTPKKTKPSVPKLPKTKRARASRGGK